MKIVPIVLLFFIVMIPFSSFVDMADAHLSGNHHLYSQARLVVYPEELVFTITPLVVGLTAGFTYMFTRNNKKKSYS